MSVYYQPVECKSFLHHFSKKFLPFNWGANPYRGCEHSCPYCFARYTHEYLGYNSDTEFDNKILVKVNAADVLEKELSRPGWRREAVNLGSVCDPYQQAEKKFKITRQVLEVFAKHKNPLFVGTKSNLILRDIDLLSVMAKRTTLIVYFTITTLDENIRRKIEPRAAKTEERLDAVKQLSDAGVTVGILFMPIFPYLTDDSDNINGVVKAVSDAGAKDLIPGVLDLRASCRSRVLSLVKEEFSDLLPKYLALYKTAYAPKDYVWKIYRAVETARRKCGFKKFEMPVRREKQTRLEV
ncbi:MAG: radical SAM protein [Methanophagales archaeon]|nr:radical SAM protein [Methanophagales archaeon]